MISSFDSRLGAVCAKLMNCLHGSYNVKCPFTVFGMFGVQDAPKHLRHQAEVFQENLSKESFTSNVA
jgi:hypothetical protein